MDLDEVRTIAERALNENVRPYIAEDVVLTAIYEYPQEWVAGFNTRVYWETREVSHALAGNGPIFIDKTTHQVRFGTTAIPVEDQVSGEGHRRWEALRVDASLLSAVIVVWTGWGSTAWPARDEARVVDVFGRDVALSMMPAVRRLEEELHESDAKHTAADLKETGDVAAAQFRTAYPDLSPEAIDALAWCYTFDNK